MKQFRFLEFKVYNDSIELLIDNKSFEEIENDISNITNQIGGFIKKLKK